MPDYAVDIYAPERMDVGTNDLGPIAEDRFDDIHRPKRLEATCDEIAKLNIALINVIATIQLT